MLMWSIEVITCVSMLQNHFSIRMQFYNKAEPWKNKKRWTEQLVGSTDPFVALCYHDKKYEFKEIYFWHEYTKPFSFFVSMVIRSLQLDKESELICLKLMVRTTPAQAAEADPSHTWDCSSSPASFSSSPSSQSQKNRDSVSVTKRLQHPGCTWPGGTLC